MTYTRHIRRVATPAVAPVTLAALPAYGQESVTGSGHGSLAGSPRTASSTAGASRDDALVAEAATVAAKGLGR